MGRTLDIQHNKHSDYASSINGMLSLIQYRQKSPWLWPDWLYALTPTKRQEDKYLSILHGFTKKVIKEKKLELAEREKHGEEEYNSDKKRLAFLDLLLSVRTQDGQKLSDKDLQEEVDTFMFEGKIYVLNN